MEETDELRAAYDFYLECRAVGRFPDDPIVRRCAMTIRGAEDAAERHERQRLSLNVLSLLPGENLR